jgi:hypothetical protein
MRTEDPPAPHQLSYDYPEQLSHIIMRCLEKDRDLRYQSAIEVLDELNDFLRTTDAVDSHLVASYVGQLFNKSERTQLEVPVERTDRTAALPGRGRPSSERNGVFSAAVTGPMTVAGPGPRPPPMPKRAGEGADATLSLPSDPVDLPERKAGAANYRAAGAGRDRTTDAAGSEPSRTPLTGTPSDTPLLPQSMLDNVSLDYLGQGFSMGVGLSVPSQLRPRTPTSDGEGEAIQTKNERISEIHGFGHGEEPPSQDLVLTGDLVQDLVISARRVPRALIVIGALVVAVGVAVFALGGKSGHAGPAKVKERDDTEVVKYERPLPANLAEVASTEQAPPADPKAEPVGPDVPRGVVIFEGKPNTTVQGTADNFAYELGVPYTLPAKHLDLLVICPNGERRGQIANVVPGNENTPQKHEVRCP